jgi:membrane protein YqaA with SNARE-associated domain
MMRHKIDINRVLLASSWIGLFWGFAEGTFFFIVPDVLLTFVALFSFRRFLVCLCASLAGSAIAGVLVYFAGAYQPAMAEAVLQSMPFVTKKMFAAAQSDYGRYGIWALVKAPFSGIPFKVYVFMGAGHIKILPIILVGLFARLVRFAVIGGFAFFIGSLFRRFEGKPTRKLVAAHAICWCVFYAFYWMGVIQS